MCESLFSKKTSFSAVFDSCEFQELEECPLNNLKSPFFKTESFKLCPFCILELGDNIKEGATRNIFVTTKETLSDDSISNSDKESTEKTKTLSNQEYFSKRINLKFLGGINEKIVNFAAGKKIETQPVLPKINIIEANGFRSEKNNNLTENKQDLLVENEKETKSKFLFSYDNESPRNNKKMSAIKRNTNHDNMSGWRSHAFKNIMFNLNASEDVFKNHLLMTYKGLIYAKEFLKNLNVEQLQRKCVKLISTDNKTKTLFFDLDNTLISKSYKGNASDICFPTFTEKGDLLHIFLSLRPFALEALRVLSKYYEIYIFTSATKEYAEKIMDILDPNKKIFDGALHRKHCLKTKKGFYIKDLRIVTNKKISDLIIIDNLTHSFSFQIDNGIPILPWYDDPNDCELKYLVKYLLKVAKFDDVREANRQYFKLSEMAKMKIQDIMN